MLKLEATGNISHYEIVPARAGANSEFLAVVIAANIDPDTKVLINTTTSNGLLTAVKSGEDIKGLRVFVTVNLAFLESHYTDKETGVHKKLQSNRVKLTYAYVERQAPPKQQEVSTEHPPVAVTA